MRSLVGCNVELTLVNEVSLPSTTQPMITSPHLAGRKQFQAPIRARGARNGAMPGLGPECTRRTPECGSRRATGVSRRRAVPLRQYRPARRHGRLLLRQQGV